MIEVLPEGFLKRPPTMDDLAAVHALSLAYDMAEYGEEDITLGDLRNLWSDPSCNLQEDTCMVFDPTGRLVGYMDMEQHDYIRCFTHIRILPGYEESDMVGNYLLGVAENWVRQRIYKAKPEARVTLFSWTPGTDAAALRRLEYAGFTPVRRHRTMEIDLQEAPAAPEWPEGITVRTFVVNQDERKTYDMVETAFQDHWGHMQHSFEQWKHWAIARESFDPTLWFLAFEGDHVAGGSLCAIENGISWVNTLGVLRPWRRNGLGMALLRHSFGEFYRRGFRKARLGVDSQNLTGATRLYERAGMHILREYITYEKELRAGVELSTQAISV